MPLLSTLAAAAIGALLLPSTEAWVLVPSTPLNKVSGINTNRTVWPYSSKCWKTATGFPTEISAHRGSRWHLPEHSLGAYWEAVLNHADFNEPDLVFSKDKQIMVNHDSFLDSTVDVASRPEYANTRTSKNIWAEDVFYPNRTSWWAADFTAEEIRKFFVQQAAATAQPYRPQYYNKIWPMATFQEYIDLNKNLTAILGTSMGFIPEIKQPFYQNTVVLNPELAGKYPYPKLGGNSSVYPHTAEDLVVAALQKNGLPSANHPVLIQSFEYETVEYLAKKWPNKQAFTGLLMLIGSANWWTLTYKGLDKIAALAKATNNTIYIAPWKEVLTDGMPMYVLQSLNIDIYASNNTLIYEGFDAKDTVPPLDLVDAIHARGLRYSGYTSYASPQSQSFNCLSKLPAGYDLSKISYKPVECPKTKRSEYFMFFERGLDNFFAENIQEAQQLREEFNFWLITQCAADSPADLWRQMQVAMKKEAVPGLITYV